MPNLKQVSDQSLIEELKSRGYEISKVEKKTVWQQIQEHIHRGRDESGKTEAVTGASAMRPVIFQIACTCKHPLCDRCYPRIRQQGDNRKCRCGSALCPICRNNWGS